MTVNYKNMDRETLLDLAEQEVLRTGRLRKTAKQYGLSHATLYRHINKKKKITKQTPSSTSSQKVAKRFAFSGTELNEIAERISNKGATETDEDVVCKYAMETMGKNSSSLRKKYAGGHRPGAKLMKTIRTHLREEEDFERDAEESTTTGVAEASYSAAAAFSTGYSAAASSSAAAHSAVTSEAAEVETESPEGDVASTTLEAAEASTSHDLEADESSMARDTSTWEEPSWCGELEVKRIVGSADDIPFTGADATQDYWDWIDDLDDGMPGSSNMVDNRLADQVCNMDISEGQARKDEDDEINSMPPPRPLGAKSSSFLSDFYKSLDIMFSGLGKVRQHLPGSRSRSRQNSFAHNLVEVAH